MKIPTPQESLLIQQHLSHDVNALALELAKRTDINRELVIEQIAGFQKIRKKIPSWYNKIELILPPQLPLEQCSSEVTASYKASLCGGQTLCDLTGGYGVDFSFMSKNFAQATYIEQQANLCQIMQHNAKILGLNNVEIANSDSSFVTSSNNRYTCIYVDPARRSSSGSKTVLLSDCQPDLSTIYPALLQRCNMLMAKLSPMLDITLAQSQMPQTTDIHVISVENECKELVFISSQNATNECTIHCINILQNKPVQLFCFTRSDEQNVQCQYTDEPQAFIYEPNASILKAGAFKSVTNKFGLKKLHPQSHLYTSNTLVDGFQGRAFKTISWFGAGKSETKTHLNGIEQANISTRNFPCSVAELRKKLKLKEGGSCYLFATTINNNKKVIIRCEKC